MNVSNPKAIQWSTPIIISLKPRPANHPIVGISIWNPPKNEAMIKAVFRLLRSIVIPLAIETAKASIAKPIAIKTIVSGSILLPSQVGVKSKSCDIGIAFGFCYDRPVKWAAPIPTL